MSGVCADCEHTVDWAGSIGHSFESIIPYRSFNKFFPDNESKKVDSGKELLISQIFTIFENSSAANWDDEGADPVKFEALQELLTFILNYPDYLSLPDVDPTDDGGFILEWNAEKENSRLNIELKGTGEIIYAVTFSKKDYHSGIKPFKNIIPGMLLNYIKMVVSR